MAEICIKKPQTKEDLEFDQIEEDVLKEISLKKIIQSDDTILLSSSQSYQGKRGWLNYITGTVLNRVVKTGMQTPLVKYLMSPKTLKKALNNDPILSETYKIILTSEPFQKLLTPEAIKIVLDSETAKQVVTPQIILSLLNHDIVANFVTSENLKFILESEVIKRVLAPEVLLQYMDTQTVLKFLKPEIIHEIAYSQLFTDFMTPEVQASFINTQGVKAVTTTEAIADILECPGAKNTMNQRMVRAISDTEAAQNLLKHEEFRKHLHMIFKTIFEK